MKRFMKVVATTLCAGIVLSSGLFASSPIVMAADDVAINEENFPDENFRAYVKENCDTNSDGVLSQSEIDATSEVDVYGKGIKSLKGIEHFTALTILYCYSNQLTSLDVSKNADLQILQCYDNQLTSIDVSNNTELEHLGCSGNQLTSLDVSNNTELYDLDCGGNQITSIDVTKNTELQYLYCAGNQLTNLDISKNTHLAYFNCGENQLTNLDVSKNTNLECLVCSDNQLANLDVSKNTELIQLYCYFNQLTNLDVSKNTRLIELWCAGNQLTSLNVSNNTGLWSLDCGDNQLTSLDVSKIRYLIHLDCSDNQLTNLDVRQNTELRKLDCSSNQLASLDVSNNVEISNICKASDYVTEFDYYKKTYTGVIAWVDYSPILEGWSEYPDPNVVIDNQTTLTSNGEILYSPSTQPTSTPVPTSVPTAGPIPTAAPTPEASKSVGSFVDRCYSVALGRDADEGGYNYWLDALNNGEICGAQAGYGFIFSGEYINKETTNEEFVTDLYSMYFGRTPDEGGFNYWVGLLNSGASREEIFAGFANSTEFDNLCADYGVVTGAYLVGVPVAQQGGVNSFVARLYNICLNRRPDQAGQAGWAQKLISGEVTGTTCAFGFVFSPEFIGKEPSNEEFVACMYRAFFGREADEAGFTAWVETLNNGGSYEDVFNGFTGSAEFANLCAGYGINP